MTRIVVDLATQPWLAAADKTLELCDSSGRVLGHFVPACASSSDREPKISEEELERRERQGGGRSLGAILADLEKRA